MSRHKPPSDHADKAVESVVDDDSPMERFNSLARRLLNVSNKRLQDERKRHDEHKRKLTKK
jgi:hypothetical protein